MEPASGKPPQARLLSSKENFGYVMQCPNGCIHIGVGNLAFRLSPQEYSMLMEMLAESARQLAVPTTELVERRIH